MIFCNLFLLAEGVDAERGEGLKVAEGKGD